MPESDDEKHLSSPEAEITDEQVRKMAAELIMNGRTIELAGFGDDMRKRVKELFIQYAGSLETHDDKTESADKIELMETEEAKERGISLEQWRDLLHVAEAKGKGKEWIAENFIFPVDGTIKTKGDLSFNSCTNLTKLPERLSVCGYLSLSGRTGLTILPEGLSVRNNLWLNDCKGLKKLPNGLSVGGDLWLSGCTGLTELPSGLSVGGNLWFHSCTGLTELPEEFPVNMSLILYGCTGLIKLPKKLSVSMNLDISGCTKLTGLPEGLSVTEHLHLSRNLNDQVKKDAERMKKEGKIGGKILNEN